MTGEQSAPGRQDADPSQLVGRIADPTLLSAELVPVDAGQPGTLAPSTARGKLVPFGATMTGVTLIGGAALVLLGVVETVANGLGAFEAAALLIGILLVATHWGWVHVAEATANSIEGRHDRAAHSLEELWLQTIKPYTRYEISSSVAEDGSIEIVRSRLRAVPSGERTFMFVREPELTESHGGDEPAAAIAERAELLRRQAARDTEAERERYDLVADAYETALLSATDERERLEARRAASEALSERINTNLREPPLVE